MFEDQTVELLPARTTMCHFGHGGDGCGLGALNSLSHLQSVDAVESFNQNGNVAIAVVINVGNVNVGGTQVNSGTAVALAGSNVALAG